MLTPTTNHRKGNEPFRIAPPAGTSQGVGQKTGRFVKKDYRGHNNRGKTFCVIPPLSNMHPQNKKIRTHVHPLIKQLFPTLSDPKVPFAGRIKYFQKQWTQITSNPEILAIVSSWVILLISTPNQNKNPPQIKMESHKKELLTKEVKCMLEKGVIIKVNEKKGQFLSNIFLREKKEKGKFRPIVNLRHLNEHIPYQKFKMESLKDLKNILKMNDFMVKIGLKDAYFTVPLNRQSGKYVGFQ